MTYMFPVLPLEDLVESFKSMNIRLDENDFKKPNPTRWRDLYASILSTLTECPTESFLKQIAPNADFEYIELFEDAIPQMHLVIALQRVLVPCGIHNFTFADLVDPKPKQLIKICSAVLNYYRFRESRRQKVMMLLEESERSKDQYESLLKHNKDLKEKVAHLKAEKEKQEPEILKVQEQIDEVARKMQENHRQQASLQKSTGELKLSLAEKRAAIDQTKLSIQRAKDEAELLSQKIVQSPERVKEEQEKMRAQLENLKDSLNWKNKRLAEVKKQRKIVKQVTDDAEKGKQLLETIKASDDKEKEILKEISQIQDRYQEMNNQMRELDQRKEKLNVIIAKCLEKQASLSAQHQNRLRVLMEQIERYKEEIEHLMKKLGASKQKKAKFLAEKQDIVGEVNKKKKISEEKIRHMKEVYADILEKVDNYNTKIAEGWNEVRTLLKSETLLNSKLDEI
ncbi:hypothetical protein CHS0354_028117 [Potamilus streckersoni]|uniref:Kinetochore protein Nuf2 N-terminal domain-containing protein n=1 Tax=Potamilus streckersoni TaxID=2493646 RepID=A0AAE0WCY9_9BIVA|nr:hypothetical protein CHS0354_028117 [Potamilus streckersoni]